MQYVPTVLPMRTDIGKADKPPPVEAVRPIKRIVTRTAPPLIYQHRRTGQQAGPGGEATQGNQFQQRMEEADRRQMCRRIDRSPVTLDTRSEHDRRHTALRKDEHLDTSVDIKV